MLLKDIIENKKKDVVYNLYFEDMEKIKDHQIYHLLKYPVIKLDSLSSDLCESYKVLIRKECYLHAINIRRVPTCMNCLRFPWCEDLSNELRKEYEPYLKEKEDKFIETKLGEFND